MSTASPLPEEYVALVDDAAIFPPGNAPLPQAVAQHAEHRASEYAPMIGPFVVSDVRLPDLLDALRSRDDVEDPLAVTVVVTGGAGALDPAVRWAGGASELVLRGVEIALRDEDDLAHNARRVTTALDQLKADGRLDDDVPVSIEPPRLHGPDPGHGWLSALDEIAAMDHRLKFRLGGVTADSFPTAVEVATCIDAALDRELAFKCTAGLHHAVAHHDDETGFDHHGFLNVLLATRASLDGSAADEVAALLAQRDPEALRAGVQEVGSGALRSARSWFTSFGCCDVRDPVEDLVILGLLPDLPLETR